MQEVVQERAHQSLFNLEALTHHLTLSAPDCYERLGTYAQMNPPVRDAAHRAGIWAGVDNGVVDVLGSDHAPHTIEEKRKPYPSSPSGMTGVQTLVPIMLDHVHAGRLTLVHGRFGTLDTIAQQAGLTAVDGVVLDVGRAEIGAEIEEIVLDPREPFVQLARRAEPRRDLPHLRDARVVKVLVEDSPGLVGRPEIFSIREGCAHPPTVARRQARSRFAGHRLRMRSTGRSPN